MDISFIKQEDPVNYILTVKDNGEIKDETTFEKMSNRFDLPETLSISIKEEPNTWSENEGTDNDSAISSHEYIKSETTEYFEEPESTEKIRSLTEGKHSRANSKRFQCKKCDAIFKSKSGLKHHHILEHYGQGKDRCQICKRYFTKSKLKVHMELHNGPPFACPICFKMLSTKESWSKHIKFIHTEKKYGCDICHKCFRQKRAIVDHMEIHVDRKRTFECKICGTCVFRQTTLTRHIKNQHPEFPLKETYVKLYLKSPNAHTDQVPDQKIVKIKKEIGKRIKKFKCQKCGTCFIHRSYFTRHLRTMHLENTGQADNLINSSDKILIKNLKTPQASAKPAVYSDKGKNIQKS